MREIAPTKRVLAVAFSVLCWSAILPARAAELRPHETILYSFQNSGDGAQPLAGLIVDKSGNLYGTTAGIGGSACPPACGSVFRLSPPTRTGAGWSFTILHDFTGGNDGGIPHGNVIFGPDGYLYGTNVRGGRLGNGGVLYQLRPSVARDGRWIEQTIHNFGGGGDGNAPQGGLVFDRFGDVDGTTALGGLYLNGMVFEVSPPAQPGGSWTESILHSFGNGLDGFFPLAGMAIDNAGDLFGTAEYGGNFSSYCQSGCGTVFELTPSAKHKTWTYSTIQKFNGLTDGASPLDPLIFDDSGDLFGTTLEAQGNPQGGYGGTAFELIPPAKQGGPWTENVLYNFPQYLFDAGYSSAGLVFDGAGNLYGTSQSGGPQYEGTAFELVPPSAHGGAWTDKILHNYNKNDGGATYPFNGLVFGVGGALYGTTPYGGAGSCTFGSIKGCGTIFSISR